MAPSRCPDKRRRRADGINTWPANQSLGRGLEFCSVQRVHRALATGNVSVTGTSTLRPGGFVTKAGVGTLTVDDTSLTLKEAKPSAASGGTAVSPLRAETLAVTEQRSYDAAAAGISRDAVGDQPAIKALAPSVRQAPVVRQNSARPRIWGATEHPRWRAIKPREAESDFDGRRMPRIDYSMRHARSLE